MKPGNRQALLEKVPNPAERSALADERTEVETNFFAFLFP